MANKNGLMDFKSFSEQAWFEFLLALFLLFILTYLLLHKIIGSDSSYEYLPLNARQIEMVSRLNMDSTTISEQERKKASILTRLDSLAQLTDTASKIKLLDFLSWEKKNSGSLKQGAACCGRKDSTEKNCGANVLRTIAYLKAIFEGKADQQQLCELSALLSNSRPSEVVTIVSAVRFRIQSYFWLVGPYVYLEVVFWSIFGVIASILYTLGVVSLGSPSSGPFFSSGFNSAEIFSQLAKLTYAPFCTLILVLGYNYFSGEKLVDIGSSKGVIVFAFIGGFYSKRMVALLDRLKDVLLPNTADNQGASSEVIVPEIVVHSAISPATVSQDATLALAQLNNIAIEMKSLRSQAVFKPERRPVDPPGMYRFIKLTSGLYELSAQLSFTGANNLPLTLKAVFKGEISTETSIIYLILE